MVKEFEARDQLLGEVLFTPESKFRIPRYQRPFSWEEDQVSDFWDDLTDKEGSFLIGSLIFNYENWEKKGFIDIIDGQQRLLTITILCAVLRDNAKEIDAKLPRLIQTQDIALEDREGNYTFRIILGDSTQEFFEKYIQNAENDISQSTPSSKEDKRIKKCYSYFDKMVKYLISQSPTNKIKLEKISNLRKKIASIQVIKISIESEEEAYEIFETTNARGVDLSVADLIKNLIFKHFTETDEKDLAKDYWTDIVNNVEDANIEMKKFLRYHWISTKKFIGEKKLYRDIKKNTTEWEEYLFDLQYTSELFNKILQPIEDQYKDYKDGHKIYKSIFAIKLMGVSQCYIFLLSILRNIKRIHTNPVKLISKIEKFTFLYSAICKRPTNVLEKIYSKYALQIENAVAKYPEKKIGGKVQSIFEEFSKEIDNATPSLEVFKESFKEISYANSETRRMIIKYILAEFDTHYRVSDEEKIDFQNVNIEHVFPQKPSKAWKVNKKDIKGYVNKLGNLTLLSRKINSKVQNNLVKDKIVEYEKSRLPVTEELVKQLKANSLEWDENAINKRQEELGILGYSKIWAV